MDKILTPSHHSLTLDCLKYGLISEKQLLQSDAFFEQIEKFHSKGKVLYVFSETIQKVINRKLDDSWTYFKAAYRKNIIKSDYKETNKIEISSEVVLKTNEVIQSPVQIDEHQAYKDFASCISVDVFVNAVNNWHAPLMQVSDEDWEVKEKVKSGELTDSKQIEAWITKMRGQGFGKNYDETFQRVILK